MYVDWLADSMEWVIRGFPQKFLIFLLGIPFEPPLVGIIATILKGISLYFITWIYIKSKFNGMIYSFNV